VVDEAGHSVPVGATGELVLRHPWPATFLDPEAEQGRYWMTIDDTVLYRSGDLARREAGGGVTVLERLDPMVKVSGQLVSLASVADVLCQHPLVEAAEVTQVPDREGQRLLVAWVVPTADASPGPELAADLQRDLHDMLGGLSVPHTVAFVDAFPPDLSPGDRRAALRSLALPERGPLMIVSVEELRKAASTSGAEHLPTSQ
jgi:acyl-coenzyme A synthetase/AMP-(fatty) acid ligase